MRRALALRAVAGLALAAACATPPGSPEAVLRPPDAARPNGAVEVRGLNAAQLAVAQLELHVRPGSPTARAEDPGIHIPVAGAVARTATALSFEPAFALTPGLTYRARVTGFDGAPYEVNLRYDVPAPRPRALVTAVHPSGDVLPENLLRFYVHFSEPMRRGEAYAHVRLIEVGRGPLGDAILEVEPELWDPETRRLTLLLQPGRIKRGLVPREELGPPLVAGGRYVLEIDSGWRDARGAPLLEGYSRVFSTTVADDRPPDPAAWTLTTPAVGTLEPLTVTLDEPLDHALLERVITVLDPSGGPRAGIVAVAGAEARWLFTPAEPWSPGEHALLVDAVLEDRAGNSVGRPFETPAAGEDRDAAAATPVRIPFVVD